MKKLTLQVFNTSVTNLSNYITTIEIPDYKQQGRTIKYLRDWIYKQSLYDEKNKSIRYYVFRNDNIYISEGDLFYY